MSTNATDAAAAAEEVAKAVFSNKGLSFGPYIMAYVTTWDNQRSTQG
jgi:hypothetical protein